MLNEDFTVATWLRTDSFAGTHVIYLSGETDTGQKPWYFFLLQSTGTLSPTFALRDGSQVYPGVTGISDNNYHHLVLRVDKTNTNEWVVEFFGSMGIQGVDIELVKSASRKAKVNVSRTQDSIGYTRRRNSGNRNNG